jgi:hypothetical protein
MISAGITGATLGMSSGYNITTEICAANRIKPAGKAVRLPTEKCCLCYIVTESRCTAVHFEF